mgnify:CR=1 FL=1
MASSKAYLHFILEQLSDLDEVSYRSMMGEFMLYVFAIKRQGKSRDNSLGTV